MPLPWDAHSLSTMIKVPIPLEELVHHPSICLRQSQFCNLTEVSRATLETSLGGK